jgi:hypothetical protein
MWTLLFCNADEAGVITSSLIGDKVVPVEQYDYFFFIPSKSPETVVEELPNYRIVNRELTLVEGA